MRRIAVLMTCHNRRDKTLRCLEALFSNGTHIKGVGLDVFLVDDGSSDGTSQAIAEHFPSVKVIPADGTRYWNGGMRMAFALALEGDFEYYLWLNDDTFLFPNALDNLLRTFQDLIDRSIEAAIVVGTTVDQDSNVPTYGGLKRNSRWNGFDFVLVHSDSSPIECDTLNGNCVLISRDAGKRIGNLEPEFVHSMGDIDYGLRAKKLQCSIWVAPGFVGFCSKNLSSESFYDQTLSPLVRLNRILQPKGLPFRQWKLMTKRHLGRFWFLYWLWPYAKVVFGVRIRR